MYGQVRGLQTCSDYQVNKLWGDKKRAACRSQGQSSSTILWDDVENKVCGYSKNSLWVRKDFPSPNIEAVVLFHPGFGSSVHQQKSHFSLQQGQELVSPKLCWRVPAIMTDSYAPHPDKLKACPWTNFRFWLDFMLLLDIFMIKID